MAAYREVHLRLPETRATDFIVLQGSQWYSVLSWTRTSEILDGPACNVMLSNYLACTLQAVDPGTGEAKETKPITVLVDAQKLLRVMVPSTGIE